MPTSPTKETPEKKKKASLQNQNQDENRFLKTRTILLSGEINKGLVKRVITQLLILEQENSQPIKLFIDSPGGDADAGYALFDMIRFIMAPVYTIGMGLVASAGAIILLGSPRERR